MGFYKLSIEQGLTSLLLSLNSDNPIYVGINPSGTVTRKCCVQDPLLEFPANEFSLSVKEDSLKEIENLIKEKVGGIKDRYGIELKSKITIEEHSEIEKAQSILENVNVEYEQKLMKIWAEVNPDLNDKVSPETDFIYR